MSLDTALASELPESYRPPWTRCDTCGRHVTVIGTFAAAPGRWCRECAFVANLLPHGPSEHAGLGDNCRICREQYEIAQAIEAHRDGDRDYYVDEP